MRNKSPLNFIVECFSSFPSSSSSSFWSCHPFTRYTLQFWCAAAVCIYVCICARILVLDTRYITPYRTRYTVVYIIHTSTSTCSHSYFHRPLFHLYTLPTILFCFTFFYLIKKKLISQVLLNFIYTRAALIYSFRLPALLGFLMHAIYQTSGAFRYISATT